MLIPWSQVLPVLFSQTCGGIVCGLTLWLLQKREKQKGRGCHDVYWGLRKLQNTGRPRVVLIGTGSVASVKIPEIVTKLHQFAEVAVVLTGSGWKMTESVAKRYDPESFKTYEQLVQKGSVQILIDEDEWDGYSTVSRDPVVHIEVIKWADCIVVAPLSANTLAKVAGGLSDNLATCILRAWCPGVPLLFAPAMNTVMWEHPATRQHLRIIKSRGGRWIQVIVPLEKHTLACGDTGRGALANVDMIVSEVKRALVLAQGTEGVISREKGVREKTRKGAWRRFGFTEYNVAEDYCPATNLKPKDYIPLVCPQERPVFALPFFDGCEKIQTSQEKEYARLRDKLSVSVPRRNRVEYLLPGLFAFAGFAFAWIGLTNICSFQKPARGSRGPLIHV